MRASTELFLWELFSIAGALYRPSLHHATGNFEGWAYRKGRLRQIQRLEAEAYLERLPGGKRDRVYRLTPKGRLAALGGKDPEAQWDRAWDGRWRLLTFDLPSKPRKPRLKLWRFLRENGMGCLQGSVWISPVPLDPVRKLLRGDRHAASLALFEANTIGGEKPGEIVHAAWNFAAIEQTWSIYANILNQGEAFLPAPHIDDEEFREWMALEQSGWRSVIECDPFLPKKLLPREYTGRKIWRRRLSLWERLRQRFQTEGFPQANEK